MKTDRSKSNKKQTTISSTYSRCRCCGFIVRHNELIVIRQLFFSTLTNFLLQFNGGTHQGRSRESCGGVGRNVAAALINLGVEETRLLSVVGDDRPGKTLIESLSGRDDMVEVHRDISTAR